MENFKNYIEHNGLEAKEYQTEGIEWCKEIEEKGRQIGEQRIRSGILADEMGLGKTIQMIGLILTRFKLRTLIVLPRALLEQWTNIIHKTLGHRPIMYHGREAKNVTDQQLKDAAIVLTTYGMFSKPLEKPKKNIPVRFGQLHEINWNRVIFDEAHHLRNRNTLNHKAGVAIKSKHKWLVTGTPIQNSISDFYGLCTVMGIDHTYMIKNENKINIAKQLILKRTKQDVGIELPPLQRHIINVEWENESEKQFAEDIHSHLNFSRAKTREANPFHMSGVMILSMLQKAKQACINMGMLEKSVQKLQELGLMDETFQMDVLKYQSKTNKVVTTILERKDNNRAKLVFCHYHEEIDIIARRLRDGGIVTVTFDGRTKEATRQEILTDKTIGALVLQIRTGCEGLNLQHFSEVYFVSPNWNPAVEDQAVARCHRIGQQQSTDVFSFRMESFDGEHFTRTIDIYTRDLQLTKRTAMKEVEEEPKNAEELEDVCAICLEKQHKHTSHKMECGHCFHIACISQWFQQKTTCQTGREV